MRQTGLADGRAAEAGARVVELHAAHGYLLAEFLSPYSNHRRDRYGGSAENRARLIVEILAGVRERVGRRVAISLRISGHELVAGGLEPRDYRQLLPLFEHAGMDLLHVAAGVYESMERIVPPEELGETPNVPYAEDLEEHTQVPVCAVGSIFSLATAEEVLAGGKADLCAMGRAQVADPQIVHKSSAGRESEIRHCTRCNGCAFWLTGDPQMYCAVNPRYKKKSAMAMALA